MVFAKNKTSNLSYRKTHIHNKRANKCGISKWPKALQMSLTLLKLVADQSRLWKGGVKSSTWQTDPLNFPLAFRFKTNQVKIVEDGFAFCQCTDGIDFLMTKNAIVIFYVYCNFFMYCCQDCFVLQFLNECNHLWGFFMCFTYCTS